MKYVKRQDGFLLIEVIVAMVIIFGALLSIAAMYTQSVTATTNANFRTKAATLAQQELETIRKNIENQTTGSQWNNMGYYPYSALRTDAGLPDGTMQTNARLMGNLSQGENDHNNKIVELSVTISWAEFGQTKNIRLVTYCLRNTGYSTFPQ